MNSYDVSHKDKERQQIEKDMQDFLSKGGKIKKEKRPTVQEIKKTFKRKNK